MPNLTKNIGPMHALCTFMGEAYKLGTQVLCGGSNPVILG